MGKIFISEIKTGLSETIFKLPEDQVEIRILSLAKTYLSKTFSLTCMFCVFWHILCPTPRGFNYHCLLSILQPQFSNADINVHYFALIFSTLSLYLCRFTTLAAVTKISQSYFELEIFKMVRLQPPVLFLFMASTLFFTKQRNVTCLCLWLSFSFCDKSLFTGHIV